MSCEHLLFPPDCLSSHRARLSCSSFWPLKSFLNPTFCAGNQNQSCVFRCVSVCVERRLCGCQHWLLWSSSFPPPVLKIKLISCITQGVCFDTCVVCNQGCGTSPPPKKRKKKKKISARSWGLHLKWDVAHKRRIWYAEQKLLKKKNHHKHLYTDRDK